MSRSPASSASSSGASGRAYIFELMHSQNHGSNVNHGTYHREPAPAIAKIHAIPLAWVIQTITDLAGQGTAAGQPSTQIANELRPIVLAMIDELEAWPALQRRGVPTHAT